MNLRESNYLIQIDKLIEQISEKESTLKKSITNKYKEIDDFIKQYSGSNFYVGYASVIRKDLEQEYKIKEESLKKEIENLNQNLLTLQKEIEFDLQKEKITLKSEMLDLSEFKYEYDKENKIINASNWIELCKKCSITSNKIEMLKEKLDKVKKYLSSKKEEKINDIKQEEQIEVESKQEILVESSKDDLLELRNTSELNTILDNYYNEKKGNTFIVDGIQTSTKDSVKVSKKLKIDLKHKSIIKLLSDKKMSKADLMRVYGKDIANGYEAEIKKNNVQKIGKTSRQMTKIA